MARRRKQKPSSNTVALALFFVGFVGALLIVSLLLKLFLLAKESHFDGAHRFTIAISSADLGENQKKITEVISFSPQEGSISRLNLSTAVPAVMMGRFLEIPIEGTVLADTNISGKESISDVLKLLILDFRSLRTNLTILDVTRLWWDARTISEHSKKDINFIENPDLSLDTQLDNYTQKLFTDESVASERESISVINGTEIPGFGSRFSRLITNMGGNVVSVSTSDSKTEHSSISYYGKKSYTLSKIEKTLGIKGVLSKNLASANIVVTLGEDRGKTISF